MTIGHLLGNEIEEEGCFPGKIRVLQPEEPMGAVRCGVTTCATVKPAVVFLRGTTHPASLNPGRVFADESVGLA